MHTCQAIPGWTDFYLGTSLLKSVIERELKTTGLMGPLDMKSCVTSCFFMDSFQKLY